MCRSLNGSTCRVGRRAREGSPIHHNSADLLSCAFRPQPCPAQKTANIIPVGLPALKPATQISRHPTALSALVWRAASASQALWLVVVPAFPSHHVVVRLRATCWHQARRCGLTTDADSAAPAMAPPKKSAASTRKAAHLARAAVWRMNSWVATQAALPLARPPVTHTM